MKNVSLFVVSMVFVLCTATIGSSSEIYDTSYQGPMNVYGQPALIIPPNQQGQNAVNSRPQGIIPMAADGLWQIGDYLWSFLPAPVRGVQSPYAVPQGSGQVTTSFVPGTP
ncbi:MAG: hypothetical protein M0T73_01780 [Deltaproteobacteria bacterium]|nr:hypothetical protein [Deltaproteobacteria bacterium]